LGIQILNAIRLLTCNTFVRVAVRERADKHIIPLYLILASQHNIGNAEALTRQSTFNDK